jgi:hypothetical protein
MDEHSKGPKPVTIVVNTRNHPWSQPQISYGQLVALAYPGEVPDANLTFTVRYTRGHGGHGAGTLTAGQSVKVKEGMVFDVARSTRS